MKSPALSAGILSLSGDSGARLRRVGRLAKQGRWEAVLRLSRKRADLERFPKMRKLRLAAATATGNVRVVEEVARLEIRYHDSPPRQSFAIVRELSQAGFHSLATRLLLARKDLQDDHHFQLACLRLLKSAPTTQSRRSLKSALMRASKGGFAQKPARYFEHVHKLSAVQETGAITFQLSSSASALHLDKLKIQYNHILRELREEQTPRVAEYRNVFVDRYGQIHTEDGATIVSKGKPFQAPLGQDRETIAEAFCALGSTNGIYHWLVDRLPNLQVLLDPSAEAIAHIPILLAAAAPRFEREAVKLCGFSDERIVNVDGPIFTERLIVARVPKSSFASWEDSDSLFARLVSRAVQVARNEDAQFSEKIYISRSATRRRGMGNESEVEKVMAERGFEICHLETMPFWRQVALFRNASRIVAPHGAGLAHLLFAKPSTNVVEILPIISKESVYSLRLCYARLSAMRKHAHALWIEEQIPVTNFWSTNVPEFLAFLDGQLDKLGTGARRHALP